MLLVLKIKGYFHTIFGALRSTQANPSIFLLLY